MLIIKNVALVLCITGQTGSYYDGECWANPQKPETEFILKANRSPQTTAQYTWRWQSQNPNGYMT